MICCVIVWAGMTISRAQLWSDPVALTEDTVEKSPSFLPARKDLANYYIAQGKKEKGHQLLEGVIQAAGSVHYVSANIPMAHSLISEGELDEEHRNLSSTLENPGKRFVKVVNALLTLNYKRLDKTQDEQAKNRIHRENVDLFEKLKQRNADPFIDYRMAKEYLALGDLERARVLFDSVYHQAPASAYYREPARKLAEKLADQLND